MRKDIDINTVSVKNFLREMQIWKPHAKIAKKIAGRFHFLEENECWCI